MGFVASEVKNHTAVQRVELRENASLFRDWNQGGETSRNNLWREGLEKGIPWMEKQLLQDLQMLVKMWKKRNRSPQKRDHPSSILSELVILTVPLVELNVAGWETLNAVPSR